MKKCLVLEAMEKCQCEYCKRIREWRTIMLKQQAEIDAMRNSYHALEEAGVIPK